MATISDDPQGTGGGSEEEAVKAVIAATTEAFNKHDAEAWTRFCLPEARLVTVRGESMQSVAEIEKGLAAIFHGRGRNAALRTLAIAVTFIRPDVALAHVTNEMSGVAAPDGQVQPPHRELSIRVLVKDGGGWRIAAFHNTILSSKMERRPNNAQEQTAGSRSLAAAAHRERSTSVPSRRSRRMHKMANFKPGTRA